MEGRNLYALRLTDLDSPADRKEHVLMTALHAGQEQSGATSALYIVNWLLSPDPLAREIRRRQSLLVIQASWATSNIRAVGGNFPAQPAPIEHGLALRLRIPFPKARRSELWMNGAPLLLDERHGFVSWVARGFACFQVNIPPERSRREDFFVVTLEYDPGETRTAGQPW